MSVQDILSKYDNDKEERFTFQIKATSPRGTFGKQAKTSQLLKEIDGENLSKMLSDFSIVTEQEESMCQQQQFNNPMGMEQQQQQAQDVNRGTFGANPFFQQKADVTEIIEKSYLEDDLYDDMSVLKDKVMGLLQAYSDDIKRSSNDTQLKQKIQTDAKKVANEYSQIIDKINNTDISGIDVSTNGGAKKEQELNVMFNLVQEFLGKFDGQKNNLAKSYSQIIETKLSRSRAVQGNLDITVLPNIPLDETFYQNTQVPVDKLAIKIQKLKQILQAELEKQQMHYSKQILMEMIHNLNDILSANDVQTVKSVVYKIEQIIKQLPSADQASVQLYDYMAKVMKATKKRVAEVDPQRKSVEKTIKRRFFDTATGLKNKLPVEHPGRHMMISAMFDKFVEVGQPENMEEFILSQLQ